MPGTNVLGLAVLAEKGQDVAVRILEVSEHASHGCRSGAPVNLTPFSESAP